MTSEGAPLRVAVVAEGALFGGIEVHLANLLGHAARDGGCAEIRVFLLEQGPVEELLRRVSSVPVERVPRSGRVAALRWLSACLDDFKPHILHAHALVPEVLGAVLARQRGPQLLATVHSDPGTAPWAAPGRTRVASLALWAARRFREAHTIAVSADVRERLIALGLAPERVELVYNGVPAPSPGEEEEATRLRFELGFADGDVVLGMIGRLDPIKGHARALRVVAALGATAPQTHLLLAGEGPLQAAIERQATELGVAQRLRLLGFRRQVGPVMRALDLALFTSDHEGLPFAALEAMRRGVPLVSFAVGGLREIVRHGETGWLVEPYDERAFAEAILVLVRDPALRRRLGAAAARYVAEVHPVEAMRERTYAIWRRVSGLPTRPTG